MANFKFVLNDPKTRKSYSLEKEQKEVQGIIGKEIGDTISGDFIGVPGVEFKITGGTDKDGVPMRRDVHGTVKKRILLTKGVGFQGKGRGVRKNKTVRGNVIFEDTAQINCKAVKGDLAAAMEEPAPEESDDSEASEEDSSEETEKLEEEAEEQEESSEENEESDEE